MNQMNCANIQELFSPAVDDRLDPHEQMRFDHHLSSCERCSCEFAQYEQLFAAVSSLPGSVMDGPAPLPETVRSFRGQARPEVSWWGRFGTTAAAAVLIAIVGIGAFQAGRNGEEGTTAMPVVADMEPPSAAALGEVYAWSDSVNDLHEMIDLTLEHPGPRTNAMVEWVVDECRLGAERIQQMDRQSLGYLAGTVKKLTADHQRILDVLATRQQSPKTIYLQQVRRQLNNHTYVTARQNLQTLAAPYARATQPRFFREPDMLTKNFVVTIRSARTKNPESARRSLRLVKSMALNEPSQRLQPVIQSLEKVVVEHCDEVELEIARPSRGQGLFSIVNKENGRFLELSIESKDGKKASNLAVPQPHGIWFHTPKKSVKRVSRDI